uniref:Uncharacterized protein n=1 Tax=Romanomermis culicivorax TaxID=13658 RepID=A0A915K518_ROMCU
TWDEDLAKFAFHYIQNSIKQYGKCPQKHNPNLCWYHGSTVDTLGENVAHNSQPLINESIWLWINE